MADTNVRHFERIWLANRTPEAGVQYFLAKARAGQLIDIAEFPVEVWNTINSHYPFETCGHHITFGEPAFENRLDTNLRAWQQLVENLPRFRTDDHFRLLPNNEISQDSWDFFVHVAGNQDYEYSIVYYPEIPGQYRIMTYVGLLFTPDILQAGNPSRPYLTELMNEHMLSESGVGGAILRIHFNPRGTYQLAASYPTYAQMAAFFEDDNTANILKNVPAIYDWPEYPGKPDTIEASAKKYQYLVLRPYGPR